MLIDPVGPFSDGANDDNTWQRSPDGEEDKWVFSTNTLAGNNSVTLVSDPESALPLAPENPIKTEPLPTANSSFEVTPKTQLSQNLTIAFIDVGQGDSILVNLPNT